ncbi:myristylated tegument protein [Cervid alphaherpesvirus 2]|uniref:Myristylated tegument protein n=1 Tax=Cervid alphaherpesvirus 2 TaxID=365327 RepID=A0A455JIW2_9ALPH|nr:myristylated tegument protein [Cervid alphaherpesvirus 2]AVT50769.1 myristylated tegument protein [Cervid alphaherpesvirus 2]
MGQAASCGWCRRNRILTRAGALVDLDPSAFEDFSLDDLQALTAPGAAAGSRAASDDEDDVWTAVVTAPRRGAPLPPGRLYRPQRREVY